MNINQKFGFDINTPHREKYDAVINLLGEENVAKMIPATIEELTKAYKEDKAFNSISLKKWAAASGYCSFVDKGGQQKYKQIGSNHFFKDHPKNLAELLVSKGIDSFSVSECVCILKVCAERLVTKELEREDKEV